MLQLHYLGLKRSAYEPALTCIKEIIFNFNLNYLENIPLPSRDDSGVLKNILGKPEAIDSVGQIIKNRYGISYCDKWNKLLDSENKHANAIIFLADTAYYIDRNAWVNYTDSFNEIILRKFISLLMAKLPQKKWPKTISKNGENIDFGVLLSKGNQLHKDFPNIVDGFSTFHKRRSSALTN